MLSLYIHIPFCYQKCNYCNFFVVPVWEQWFIDLRENYFQALMNQIDFYAKIFPKEKIKTIYLWWGTPLLLGKKQIIELIQKIKDTFDLEFLEEISFELNPNPYADVLNFIQTINEKFKEFFRIRYSIWIQSFDDEVLKISWRDYFFNSLIWFMRDLPKYKKSNNVFNFDFIAFGKYNFTKKWEKILWDSKKIVFFQNLVQSHFLDSFSIYTLELFAGSFWFDRLINQTNKDQANDDIYSEFDLLKWIIQEAWYQRYEISNFALSGKTSIHNDVYWNMWSYIWLWISAHSFLEEKYLKKINKIFPESKDLDKWIRFENTKSWDAYLQKDFIDLQKTRYLDEKNFLIEKFFLGLRTKIGIVKLDSFKKILIRNYIEKLEEFQELWFVNFQNDTLKLTSKWMDVYNEVVLNLVNDFK